LSGRKGQYGRTHLGNRYLPQPNEAYRFWNRVASAAFARSFMREQKVSAADRARVQNAVRKIMFWQGRCRFAAKFTGPPRIQFLSSLFPGAIFVHIVRDGRAVVHSLLKVPFWRAKGGYDNPFWEGGVSEERLQAWKSHGSDPAVLAAMQWQDVIRTARVEAASLNSEQYFEVRYEDVIADPVMRINAIAERCGLNPSARITRYLHDIPRIESFNSKFREEFSPELIAKLSDVMNPELRLLGYE
jgi:omega-hydroxy-beta-dihydromenaquinone-9 sulfotransferase